MNKEILFIGFFIISLFFVGSAYSDLSVASISPINKSTCLSSQDSETIYYTVSSSSNESQIFLFYVLNLTWIHTNDSVLMPPQSAIQLPFYIAPRNVPDGNYTTRIWFCRQEVQANITGYTVRNCLEGSINVEVSERCRISGTGPSNFLLILAIVALITIFYMIYLKLAGK